MFPTTNWAMLADATLSGGDAEREALTELCEDYWKPISSVIRARGVPIDEVEDLTQDFLILLMNGSFFRRATRERGKFRTFLLNALKNFLVDSARKNSAMKRGGDLKKIEFQDDSILSEDEVSRFDWAWAETLFTQALETTGAEVKERRGEAGWQALQGFLTGGEDSMDYVNISNTLNLSVNAAKTEVSRLRRKFRENLRRIVAKTVTAPHEIEEELVFLKEALMRKPFRGDV